MVFGNMGAPIEHFQGNDTTTASTDATVNYYNCNDDEDGEINYTIMQGDDKYCMKKTYVELSEDLDMFNTFDNATTNWTDDDFDCSEGVSLNIGGNTYCKNVSEGGSGSGSNITEPTNQVEEAENNEEEEEENNEEENNEEENNEEENNGEENNEEENNEEEEEETNEEEEEEEDDDAPTTSSENFTGSMNIEHFSGQNVKERLLSLNLLLKSLLFACLFYIISHPDTKAVVLKNMKFLKRADYLVVSMVIFFICYYILSIFV